MVSAFFVLQRWMTMSHTHEPPALPGRNRGYSAPYVGRSEVSVAHSRFCSPGIVHTVPHPRATPPFPMNEGSVPLLSLTSSLSEPVYSARSVTIWTLVYRVIFVGPFQLEQVILVTQDHKWGHERTCCRYIHSSNRPQRNQLASRWRAIRTSPSIRLCPIRRSPPTGGQSLSARTPITSSSDGPPVEQHMHKPSEQLE